MARQTDDRDRRDEREPQDDAPQAPRGKNPGEVKVYGVNACLALFANRADDIIRVYLAEERLKEFGPLVKWCAKQRKAYHVQGSDELERVAASVHHEGIVLLAREPKRLGDAELLTRAGLLPAVCPLLFLDGVGNPHNIGSMLRIAAHFGVPYAFGRNEELPRLTPSATRMAEGGIEHVTLAGLAEPGATVKRLQAAGFALVATAGDADADLYTTELPPRAIFALGNEVRGVSASLRQAADLVVRIPGTGNVESLNVAVATGVVLSEFWRQHRRAIEAQGAASASHPSARASTKAQATSTKRTFVPPPRRQR